MMNVSKKLMVVALFVVTSQAYGAGISEETPKETLRSRVEKIVTSIKETSVAKFVSLHATTAYNYTSTKTQQGWTFTKANPYKCAAGAIVALGVITLVVKKCCAQEEKTEEEIQ